MKYLLAAFALSFTLSAIADTYVDGYQRKDGTYVEPHYRSSPNSTTYDNYSTKGNVNPYNGNAGTQEPDRYESTRINPKRSDPTRINN